MNEVLKINYETEQPTVSARELHEFLEVGTAFKDWFPRMCEYGFTKDVDLNPLKIERVQICSCSPAVTRRGEFFVDTDKGIGNLTTPLQ